MVKNPLVAASAGLVIAGWIGACGSVETQQESAGTTGSGGSGAMSASSSGGMGGSIAFGGQGGQAGSDAMLDTTPIVTSPFDCNGCLCDGATHYCIVYHGGAPTPPEP